MTGKLNVTVTASADGKSVLIDTTTTDAQPNQMIFPVEAIAPLISGLLGAATVCARKSKSGANPFARERDPSQEVFVQASGVALSDPPGKPDLIAMTFAFGQTQLNIGLSRKVLQPLGTALLAASADLSSPQ